MPQQYFAEGFAFCLSVGNRQGNFYNNLTNWRITFLFLAFTLWTIRVILIDSVFLLVTGNDVISGMKINKVSKCSHVWYRWKGNLILMNSYKKHGLETICSEVMMAEVKSRDLSS